ncbi:MAG: hypothetical protein HY587_01305 [Candidatus Omnitrophica bacterium]|nr:hypothetical protein [Candidatus Omnitrophota bacterium]
MQQEADVLICLEEQIREKCEATVQKAESEAAAMRKKAQSDAAQIVADARARAEAKFTQIRLRCKSQAALEAGQLLTRVKAEAVSESIKLAGSRLENVQTSPRYKFALAKFLSEALEALKPSSGPFRIIARREDESTLKDLLSHQRVNASIDPSGIFSGGLEIVDEKGHMRVVNTFESRLRQGFEAISDRVRKVLHV